MVPGHFGPVTVCYSLFLLLLLLLPEALQQDTLVGGVEHSRLLQVLFGDVTETNDDKCLNRTDEA